MLEHSTPPAADPASNGQAVPRCDCESTERLFARHGVRCTRQRRLVYESLCSCRTHPTAEEIFQLVQPAVDRVSLATVYNSLEVLCGVGLVQKIPMSNGCCRFDADTSTHMHIRFRDTAEIVDVPDELEVGDRIMELLPKEMLREIERRFGVRVDGVSIQLLARRRKPG